MNSQKKSDRFGLDANDLELWQKVDPAAFSSVEAETAFNRRSLAVKMYVDRRSLKEIFSVTSISKQQLYRLISRCLEFAVDGTQLGFRGLLLYKHVSDRIVVEVGKPKAKAGSLSIFLRRHPTLCEELTNYALFGKRKDLKKREVNPSVSAIHHEFLRLCDEINIRYPNYPFNSASEGKPAIRRWVNKIRLENQLAFLKSNDPEAAKFLLTSRNDSNLQTSIDRSYKRVECDGHKIDFNCTIELPSPSGDGVILTLISRLWLIVLIDAMNNVVLGYSISFGRNYSAVDVMRAVRNSLMPWQKRKLTVKTIDYRDGDGFPSGTIDDLSYACFDELWLDNAKSHLSHLFLGYIERTIGCVPVFSPGRSPNAHPFVEGFFNLLEESGIHQSIGTTGSNIKDKRREKPSTDLRYHLSYELLCDLVDLLIARINGSAAPNSSISRLDALRSTVSRKKYLIRRIPVKHREQFALYDIWEEGKIGKNHGRPVIRFYGANYSNDVLHSAFLLVGRKVLIRADSQDFRAIHVTLDDGTTLGTLYAERRWRQTRHGLITRRECLRLYNDGHFRTASDLPKAFRLHMEKEASQSKAAAAKFKRICDEQKSVELSSSLTEFEKKYTDCAERLATPDRKKDQDEFEKLALDETLELLKNVRTQYRN